MGPTQDFKTFLPVLVYDGVGTQRALDHSRCFMLATCTANGKRVRHYGHTPVVLSFTTYPNNGRTCLRLMNVDDDREAGPRAVCTVNLPSVPMAENEVAIKTWYENVGMLGWLMDEGIVSEPQHYAYFSGVFIPVCCLLTRDDQEF